MPEPTEVVVTNNPDHPVPTQQTPAQQLPAFVDAYRQVGPNGFVLVLFGSLIGVILVGAMYMMYASLNAGQVAAKIAQDHLYEQLKQEQKSSELREDKLLDRADKQAAAQSDRWEKSREKQIALEAKVDALLSKLTAIEIVLKLAPKEGK